MAAIIAPALVGRPWYGRGAGAPVHKLLTRSLGVRDVALGLGVILAIDRGAPVRGWVEAGALADAGDLLATLLAFNSVPRLVRWTMVPGTSAFLAAALVAAPSVD
jgi:hypothetical protein